MRARFIFREDLFSYISVLGLCIKEVLFPKHIFHSEIVLGINIEELYFINISNLQRYGSILCVSWMFLLWAKLLKPNITSYILKDENLI